MTSADLIRTEEQLAEIMMRSGHMHCEAGCEKSAGVWGEDHVLRCAICRAPFVECSPEICE